MRRVEVQSADSHLSLGSSNLPQELSCNGTVSRDCLPRTLHVPFLLLLQNADTSVPRQNPHRATRRRKYSFKLVESYKKRRDSWFIRTVSSKIDGFSRWRFGQSPVVFGIEWVPLWISTTQARKNRVMPSNVKPTFFQDRKLSFCCFCSTKDWIYSFLK
jgi:hypothetical protein